MESQHPNRTDHTKGILALAAVVAAAALIVSIGLAALLVTIFERKREARNPFYRVVDLTDTTEAPAVWGKNFPLQYDQYLRTVDMVETKYGGSEALPRDVTPLDPRDTVTQSKLEEEPRLRRMWAGYSFAVDFREERGHAYMLEDQLYTRRQEAGQPGACLNCHASTYVAYKRLGNGDIKEGFDKMNRLPYGEARELVTHPVSCIDCHNPAGMELRVTRPAFIEGIRDYKRNVEGVEDYDVNTMATRMEMRSYVCGQCHVEYYFKGKEKRLTYPWSEGMRGDDILAYYDHIGFKDWTHKETGAASLKAQHPEFETWNQGIHSRAGVSCADCHMPYTRVGAMKISDHHVNSPLLKINTSCQTCHRVSEGELKSRAERIQDRTAEMKDRAMTALTDLLDEYTRAREESVAEDRLAAARVYQRKATFLLDFVEAENSGGFHAPQESARILTLAIDHAHRGRHEVARARNATASRTETRK